MPRVLIHPMVGETAVSGEAIRASLHRTSREPAESPVLAPILLGTPSFNLPAKHGTHRFIPVGQLVLAQTVFRRAKGRQSIASAIEAEYRGIATALHRLGCSFHVVNLDAATPELRTWLVEKGARALELPGTLPQMWQRYPRDLFVYLPHARVLLAHAKLFKLKERPHADCALWHSEWGEGGRVLASDRTMLVGRNPQGGRPAEARMLDALRDRGMRVTALPWPLFYALNGRAEPEALYLDKHLDRVAALVLDWEGRPHLILDPGFRTGSLLAPRTVEDSIALVRRACDAVDVEVHVPERLALPYAMSAVQLDDGRVLVSDGDSGLAELFASLVGPHQVCRTSLPLLHYPVFAGAGIHCLVTETPIPLFQDRSSHLGRLSPMEYT